MSRALARRCQRTHADLVFVASPRGFGKTELAAALLDADAAALAIELAGASSEAALDRLIVEHLIEAEPTSRAVGRGLRTMIFRHPEALFRAGLAHSLVRWVRALLPIARVIIISRGIPAAFAAAFADRTIETIGAADFAFRPDASQLERLALTHAQVREFSAEFGVWPAAWQALIRARESGQVELPEESRAELADMVDSTIEELGAARDTVLALAVLGRATLEEVAVLARRDDARCSLEHFDGYVTRTDDGRYALPSFFRTRIFSDYPTETAAFVAAAISNTTGKDPLRALVISLERDDAAGARSILDAVPLEERDRLMAGASDVIGAESFLRDDDLFLTWWRMPRSHYGAVVILERVLSLRESSSPTIRARRQLAIALFSIQSHRVASMTHAVAAMVDHPDLSPRLRSLARAKLAWLHAWQGDGDAFERLAPTLDREHPDSVYAIERYAFIQCIGSRETRRALLDARLTAASGRPDFERGTATYIMIDGFFFDDDEQYADALARLRDLAVHDAVLAHALAYIDGEQPHLDFASHPRFRAFAILVRAAAEPDLDKRLLLLRGAIAHADESLEVEIRIATRLAFAYAAPREAGAALTESAALARGFRSEPYGEAIIYAERLIVGGCLPGLARRFMVASDRPRLRLGLLDGTIAGPGGQPIQIAQRQFELMAFLALHETAGADRDAILDAIWPDLDPTAAAHALKTAAHRIRTALSDPAAVLLTPRGYRLPDSIETDVERLEMILATVDPEDVAARLGGLSAAYRLVAVAVEQVRDGISRWTWVDRYIPRLDFLLRRLARVIAARAIHTGRFEFAHRIVGDLRTLDEADETAFEIAIDAYFAAGNQISARREYDRYVEVLKTFGGAPAPAVAALFNTAAGRRTRA